MKLSSARWEGSLGKFGNDLVMRNEVCGALLSMLPPTTGLGSGGLLHQKVKVAQAVENTSAAERERLLVEHLPTVRYLARRIHERLPQHVDFEDLVSAGVLGLIDALSKFDYRKKVQFKSYSQFRIRGAIMDSLRNADWSPRELRRKGRAMEEALRTTTQRLGRAPSEHEISIAMDLSLSEYQSLLGDLKGLEIGSLHTERFGDSGDEELSQVPCTLAEDPLFHCLKGEMKQRVADALDELPEKERMVLTLYYFEELTMKEIGFTLGVVESRVSQIHSSAVIRLRVALSPPAKEPLARTAANLHRRTTLVCSTRLPVGSAHN